MKLETHRCDICYELLYIPERSLHLLELDRKEDEPEADLSWELCSECYDAFLKWVTEKQEETTEEN